MDGRGEVDGELLEGGGHGVSHQALEKGQDLAAGRLQSMSENWLKAMEGRRQLEARYNAAVQASSERSIQAVFSWTCIRWVKRSAVGSSPACPPRPSRSTSRSAPVSAITGIAGPRGGSASKPVGTVVFARAERGKDPSQIVADQRFFDAPGRGGVRLQAALCALDLLLP